MKITIVLRMLVVITSVLLIGARTEAQTSDEEIADIIKKTLNGRVPHVWMNMILQIQTKDEKFRSIQLVQKGIFNEQFKYWPRKVRVLGTTGVRGKERYFFGIGSFSFKKDDYGEWKADLLEIIPLESNDLLLKYIYVGGNIDIVKKALSKGADINVRNDGGQTALIQASCRGDDSVVQELLNKGANVHLKDIGGTTALWCASIATKPSIVKTLLDNGADVNSLEENGQTALMVVSNSPDVTSGITVVKILLNAGADIHARDVGGWTALTIAVMTGKSAIVQILLANGAEVNVKDKDNKTILEYALESRDQEIVKLIKEAGVK